MSLPGYLSKNCECEGKTSKITMWHGLMISEVGFQPLFLLFPVASDCWFTLGIVIKLSALA